MIGDLSSRLRDLRDKNHWTVADMAERTGIPKRSLDKYMLREGASLPGFDAVCALSKGLGVSLDWLVFGADVAGQGSELVVEHAAYEAVKPFAETLLHYHRTGGREIFSNEAILGLSPEEWAADCAHRASEKVREFVANGTTREELMLAKHARTERLIEIVRDRSSAVRGASSVDS